MSALPAPEVKAARDAVIRRLEAAEETSAERLVKKHVPAWVVSGAVHVGVIALAILVFGARKADTKPADPVISNTAEKVDEPEEKNLLNDEIGVDTKLESALPDITRVEEKTVDEKVTTDNVGQPAVTDAAQNGLQLPGIDARDIGAGVTGAEGTRMEGGAGNLGALSSMTAGRSGATKSKLLREGGGNKESEAAVARGLKWLASQQKQDGGWTYDKGKVEERTAATGMALLPFLAAGVTHKGNKEFQQEKYEQVVKKGLDFLIKLCPPLKAANEGKMSGDMYAQAIATLPLCEAYGMTKDKDLKQYAQAAINYIQRAQAANGSWGYSPNSPGDTSIVGWQIQALKAAKLSKDLVVDDRVLQKANRFLDSVAGGSKKAMYGYTTSADAEPGTAKTAIGLLCRYYVADWGPVHPSMIEGVSGLSKNGPKGGPLRDMYYYYYATQVVHFFEGEDWKAWNEGPRAEDGTRKGGMRDWLVGLQVKTDANLGSWEPEGGTAWIGNNCGRLGTTAMCLLTLEVYYRHLPLYKRSADGKAVQITD